MLASGFKTQASDWGGGKTDATFLLRRPVFTTSKGHAEVKTAVREAKLSSDAFRMKTVALAAFVPTVAGSRSPGRQEITGEDHWSGLVHWSEQPDKIGVWISYPVSTDPEAPVTPLMDHSKEHRGIRHWERNQDGTILTQINVYDQDPQIEFPGEFDRRADGNLQKSWTMEKEKAIRKDGVVHPVLPPNTDVRMIFLSRPDAVSPLGLWLRLRLPHDGTAGSPGRFRGELVFPEEGGHASIVFIYSEVTNAGKGVYVYTLDAMSEIQEKTATPTNLVNGAVNFDAFSYRDRSDQLPADPAEWMPGEGWKGRTVSLEIEGGKMWRSEGEAVWNPPDASDIANALVFTGSQGYFFGPRMVVLGQNSGGDGVDFEVGKRSSDTLFQRVVLRYNGEGECVRIEHEMYYRNVNSV